MVSPNSGTTASTTTTTATTTATATTTTTTATTITNTNTDTKVPDVYILMGPIGTGKSTALKCIKEKLNPLNVMVASGEYKSKYFYPIIPNMGFGNNNSIAATINGITPLQIGAYYTLMMVVNDAMNINKKNSNSNSNKNNSTNIDVIIMETSLTPNLGQPLLDSPMVKKFIFLDSDNDNENNKDMIVQRRIQRDYIDKNIICTETDKLNIIKSVQEQSKDYWNVMNDAKKQNKLATSGNNNNNSNNNNSNNNNSNSNSNNNNDIVLIKESHTPDQVADMIISSVQEWHQYIL